MLSIIAPAKNLDFKIKSEFNTTKPIFSDKTNLLIEQLQKLEVEEIQDIMHLSTKLADLNFQRFQDFAHNQQKAAIFAFNGQVYQGINARSLNKSDINYLNDNLFILSGLYGILQPLSAIVPYRLEMGVNFHFLNYKNLYEFWQFEVTNFLNNFIKKQHKTYLLNLASKEYSKVVNFKKIDAEVIDFEFKDKHQGDYKTIAIYAKIARGLMVNFIAKTRPKNISDLTLFNFSNYFYSKTQSTSNKFVFLRDEK